MEPNRNVSLRRNRSIARLPMRVPSTRTQRPILEPSLPLPPAVFDTTEVLYETDQSEEEEQCEELVLNDPEVEASYNSTSALVNTIDWNELQHNFTNLCRNQYEEMSSEFMFSYTDNESNDIDDDDEYNAISCGRLVVSIKINPVIHQTINWAVIEDVVEHYTNHEYDEDASIYEEVQYEESNDDVESVYHSADGTSNVYENIKSDEIASEPHRYDVAYRNSDYVEQNECNSFATNATSMSVERDKGIIQSIKLSERKYLQTLIELHKKYKENSEKYPDLNISYLFGDIEGLLNFHENSFLPAISTCYTLSDVAKKIKKMEKEFDVYLNDKWLRSQSVPQNVKYQEMFIPHTNWAENYLSQFKDLLENQFYRELKSGFSGKAKENIELALSVIHDLIRQCEEVAWLKNIKKNPEISCSGKYHINDSFKIKINNLSRGEADAILMDNCIICVSQGDRKECFGTFNISDISHVIVKKSKTLNFVSKIQANRSKPEKLTLTSKEAAVINKWKDRLKLKFPLRISEE